MNQFLKFFKTKKGQSFLLITVLTLAIFVRFWKIEYLPFQSDWDEYAYLFAGTSLIETNIPTSVSSFTDGYKADTASLPLADIPELLNLNIRGTYVLVEPWFDHPPLLPLITGSWILALGYPFPSHVPSLIYRLPMLVLSGLTLYLIFLISKHFYKYWGGLFSLILFGFSPSLIIIQRMVVGENLYIPLLLLTLYLALKNKPIFTQILLSVFSGLSKITGLVIIPIIGFYYLLKKEYKKTAIYLIGSLTIFITIYSLYGYLINWSQFITTLKAQSFRLLGWTNPANIFSRPGFHQIVSMDMSYYLIIILGLISLFTISNPIKRKFLNFSIFSSLGLIWVTSPENSVLGWYKLPLFVFLSIAAGQIIKLKSHFPLILLLTITLLNNYGLIRYTNHPFPDFWPFRLVIGLALGTVFLLSLKEKLKPKITRTIIASLLALYILLSFYITDQYYDSICENKHCPLPIVSFTQLLKS